MMNSTQVAQLARYNQWMNDKLYGAAAGLGEAAVHQDRGAFFKSLHGTLNHLAVADTLWLQRFAAHPDAFESLKTVHELPTPTALDQPLASTMAALALLRRRLDDTILAFAAEVRDAQLAQPFSYKTTKGVEMRMRLGDVLMHFFNHQTHHRGQATTLLSQAGVDMGPTDLLLLLPHEP